jgi:hypothetical protein
MKTTTIPAAQSAPCLWHIYLDISGSMVRYIRSAEIIIRDILAGQAPGSKVQVFTFAEKLTPLTAEPVDPRVLLGTMDMRRVPTGGGTSMGKVYAHLARQASSDRAVRNVIITDFAPNGDDERSRTAALRTWQRSRDAASDVDTAVVYLGGGNPLGNPELTALVGGMRERIVALRPGESANVGRLFPPLGREKTFRPVRRESSAGSARAAAPFTAAQQTSAAQRSADADAQAVKRKLAQYFKMPT